MTKNGTKVTDQVGSFFRYLHLGYLRTFDPHSSALFEREPGTKKREQKNNEHKPIAHVGSSNFECSEIWC